MSTIFLNRRDLLYNLFWFLSTVVVSLFKINVADYLDYCISKLFFLKKYYKIKKYYIKKVHMYMYDMLSYEAPCPNLHQLGKKNVPTL